ncbi:hypothetical protein AZE42_01145, partial [Rhizopogon vesiculosus]
SRLLQRANECENWLEEWQDDLAYLAYPDSVVVKVSYYYGFDARSAHLLQTPAARAACLARVALVFRQKLQIGQVKSDETKKGEFCMDAHRWMFDCCRIPGLQGLDWSVSHAGANADELGHIIIARRNRQIQHIYHAAPEEYPGDPAHLAADPHNHQYRVAPKSAEKFVDDASILYTIHSSAFLISLDTDTPTTSIAHSRSLWHGSLSPSTSESDALGLKNPWVHRLVQFIVFDNARAGIMRERSVVDGTHTTRMCDEVLDWLADPSLTSGPHQPPYRQRQSHWIA